MKLRALVVLAVPVLAFAAAPPPVTKAVAVLAPLGNSGVSGTVSFTKESGGLKIQASISGLKPGAHGFHVHEFGDCSAPDGTSAGPHFNPSGEAHAGPQDPKRHAGDMGNLTAGPEGTARLEYVDRHASLEGPSSVLGRGVIVHADADDLKSQPAGNAGGRIACGVIGIAKAN